MSEIAGPQNDPFVLGAEKSGLLDKPSLDRLIRAKGASKESTVVLAQHLGLIAEEDLLRHLAAATGLPTTHSAGVDLAATNPLPDISVSFLRKARAFPFQLANDEVAVAVADPFSRAAADAIAYKIAKPVTCLIASAREIDAALGDANGNADPSGEALVAKASVADVEALQDIASGAPVIKTIAGIIEDACARGASDIHFEPTETVLRVRMRIDGALRDIEPIAYSQKLAAISRLKIIAQMDIAETRLPQDGRAKTAVRGRDVDLRISSSPTLYGESIVVRILDRSAVSLTLDDLGYADVNRSALEAALSSPNGLIFVSGPTGSGKTTTLYAALLTINSPERKLFTVEDPIEYRLKGVNQVQVNPKIGLTFASALRSLLRQDPDIMMVGEVRDPETAQIAVQAALTGHLVLATIHTNSAASTVTRLIDMGVEEYLIGSCASAFVAQRLVGVLCRHCVGAAPAPAAIFERFGLDPGGAAVVGKAVGCAHCRSTGFSGRTTVNEVIRVSHELTEAISRRATAAEIEKIAAAQGMRTMAQDGLIKAARGVTTVEEVLRAVRT